MRGWSTVGSMNNRRRCRQPLIDLVERFDMGQRPGKEPFFRGETEESEQRYPGKGNCVSSAESGFQPTPG
jgi:hypothetical protein